MTHPTIAVLGATGLQGGAVVTALLKHDKFLVRAVTRNAAKAGNLAKEQNVEVVEADMGNKASLVKVSDKWGLGVALRHCKASGAATHWHCCLGCRLSAEPQVDADCAPCH